MYWNLDLVRYLHDAPFPSNKNELVDYAERIGAPIGVITNLRDLDSDIQYESIEDIWPDYPTNEDFYYDEDSNS